MLAEIRRRGNFITGLDYFQRVFEPRVLNNREQLHVCCYKNTYYWQGLNYLQAAAPMPRGAGFTRNLYFPRPTSVSVMHVRYATSYISDSSCTIPAYGFCTIPLVFFLTPAFRTKRPELEIFALDTFTVTPRWDRCIIVPQCAWVVFIL